MALCRESGIKPLTCTIFDPANFALFLGDAGSKTGLISGCDICRTNASRSPLPLGGVLSPACHQNATQGDTLAHAGKRVRQSWTAVKICNILVTQHQFTNFDNWRIFAAGGGLRG
jgi:hypothetical protein